MLEIFILGLFAAGLLFAAGHDVITMTIPNWVSAAFLLVFPIAAFAVGASWSQIGFHYLAGLIGLVVCYGLFAVNAFGGGDAKLLPSVLVWIGPAGALDYIYGIALSGGLLALLFLVSRRFIPKTAMPGFIQKTIGEGRDIPYAVAIAFGAFWAATKSPIIFPLIQGTGLTH